MSYAQLLVVRYSSGARERMGPSFSVCSAYQVVPGDDGPSIGGRFIFFAQNACRVGFCESKLGETMRRLNKKREGKVPARGWLGLKMEFLGWLLWERTRAAVGWEGTGWGRNGVLRSIAQVKNLSYFEISFGCWMVFSLSAIVLERSFYIPDFTSQFN